MGAFAAVLLTLGGAVQLALSQTGVCTRSVASTQTYMVYVSVGSSYTYGCGWWNARRCRGVRYHSQTQQLTRTVYHTERMCCSGYSGDGNQCSPICDDCDYVCEAPNTCVCPAGYTGDDCSEDIDECQSPGGVCEHTCNNTVGSYQCICPDGTVLAENQMSCIESPQNVMLTAISSTSLNFTWDPPQLGDLDGVITRFIITCSPIEYLLHILFSHRRSFIYDSLSPYTPYTCCVTADTTSGSSSPACDTETTLEDVPSGAPENVTVAAVSPFAIEIQWFPPTVPNGNIVSYTIYSSSTPVANVSGSEVTYYLLDGFSPYQEVSVSVSASTMIGEGPQSEQRVIRTQETAPSAVASMQVKTPTPNLLHVMWEPPHSPNGAITGYVVQVTNLSSSSLPLIFVVPPNEYQVNISSGIEPYVPYAVSVRANSSAGLGEPVEVTVYTVDGIPQKGPTIVSASRTEATTAMVEWENLSLEDLRGNLSSYEVVYYDLLEEQYCPAQASIDNETVSVTGRDPRAIITDLDPGLQYCVAVAAKTSAGVGEFSHRVIPLYTNSVFTVTLVEVQECTQWILEMPWEKSMDLVRGISAGIQKFCHCQFPGDYIGDEELMCNSEAIHTVVFQGRIISTNDRDSSDLVKDLEEWVSTEPTVMVQEEMLQVVKSETQSDSSSEGSDMSSAVVGAIIAVVVLLLLLITAIVVTIIYIRWRKHSKAKVDLTSHVVSTSPTSSDEVLKELSNPFYGYGTGTRESAADEAVYQQPPEELKELTNPTYGLAEPKTTPEKIVPNPMYIQQQQMSASPSNGSKYTEVPAHRERQWQGLAKASTSAEYSEVPAALREGAIYDAPANN